MSINRVKFDIQGTEFTLPINPLSYNNRDDNEFKLKPTLGAGAVSFVPYFDSRPRTMSWRALPNKSPYNTIIPQLRSAVGISGVRINHRDLDIGGTVNIWKPITIHSVSVKLNQGSGPPDATSYLKYDIDVVFTYKFNAP